jgi:hypothetical protein
MNRPVTVAETKRPDTPADAGSGRRGLLAAAAVTLWPLVYFYPAVLGWMSLVPFDGVIQNVPLRVAASDMVRAGHLPLWNPHIFSGMPLHAAAQAGVLFPLNWPFLFLTPFAAANVMVVSTYMVAGLGAYLYARRAGASIAGAALTGLVFESSGFLVGQLSHINIAQTAALLPWVLWAVEGYGEGLGRKWGALAALFVALQAFAGHQQTFAYSLLLASAYTLSQAFAGEGARRRRYLIAPALLLSGVSLAAVQILPTAELLRNSLRAAATYDFFTSFSLPPAMLKTFLAPYLLGGGDGHVFGAPYLGTPFYTEYVGYVGVCALMLTAVAVTRAAAKGDGGRRDSRTIFWAAAALVALALALGRHWPFDAYRLVYQIPLLNLFRVPARHLLEVDFALAVLAGRGLTALAKETGGGRASPQALAACACVLLLTCAVVTLGAPSGLRLAGGAAASLTNAPELFAPLVAAAVAAVLLWLYAKSAGRNWAAVLLLVSVALDLALFGHATGWRAHSPRPEDPSWREPPPLAYLRAREGPGGGRARLLSVEHDFDPDRPVAVGEPSTRRDAARVWVHPNAAMTHGAENAAGYEGFGLARYGRLAGDMKVWGEMADADRTLRGPSRALDLLNVRHLLAPAAERPPGPPAENPQPTPAPPGRWKFLAGVGGVAVYENTRALPRAWLAAEARALTPAQSLDTIRAGRLPGGAEWNPLRTALVTPAAKINLPPAARDDEGRERRAAVKLHEPNRIEVETSAPAPSLLVLAENYYPGWRARLDGRPAEILRVNYGLRGVVVPAGAHEVVFIYRPASVLWGLAVSLLTAALLLLWSRGR